MVVLGIIVALAVLFAAIYIALANWPRWAGLDPSVWRSAYYFGSTDAGGRVADRGWFARGNGAVAVLEDGLHFRRAFSGFEIVIPRAAIKSVEIGGSHAGKHGPPGSTVKIVWEKDDREIVSGFSVSRSAEVTKEFKRRIEKIL